uniref:Uncharacterized protein n=1 Tax=Anguilla anguilla TaxID=7936 RepID=A0A0E9R8I9_ANGAN
MQSMRDNHRLYFTWTASQPSKLNIFGEKLKMLLCIVALQN